jgi:hypothetical protein
VHAKGIFYHYDYESFFYATHFDRSGAALQAKYLSQRNPLIHGKKVKKQVQAVKGITSSYHPLL